MEREISPYDALRSAVLSAGSQSAFARSLGVSQTAVWKWLQKSRLLPAEYVLTAERIYGVSRHLLRPDIYPVDLPPFAPMAGTAAGSAGEGLRHRQASMQRDEDAQPRLPFASTIEWQEALHD